MRRIRFQPLQMIRRFARLFSTEIELAASSKAPLPKHERPSKASFFTGKPAYYETLFFLQDVLENAPKCPPNYSPVEPRHWLSKPKLSELLKYELSDSQHETICQKLKSIESVSEFTGNLDLKALIDSFTSNREAFELKTQTKEEEVDSFGRVWAIGRRKSSVAKVCLIKGEGKVMVNEKLASEYFSKISNLMEIIKPFQVTNRLGCYNVWALTQNGGTTGKAGAITLGISKALASKEPELKPVLDSCKNVI